MSVRKSTVNMSKSLVRLEKCHETRVLLQENVSRTHVKAADAMAPIKGLYFRYYIDTGMHTGGLSSSYSWKHRKHFPFVEPQ